MELGLSQEDLAAALGYKSRSTIAKIEAGENDVSHAKLERFAQVLGTTVSRLCADGSFAGNHSVAYRAADEVGGDCAAFRAGSVTAVILAGGRSTRNSSNIPNQFINVAGKPIIMYCLETYQRHPMVDAIYVVCLSGWEDILTAYVEQYGITKFAGTIPAGESGILSVKSAFDYLQGVCATDDIVVLQESTRPLVSEDIISKLLLACREMESAILCEPMDGYLQFFLSDNGAEYINRDCLIAMQSPEAYRMGVLQDVFGRAAEEGISFDDTCCGMMLYRLGYRLNFCEGQRNNFKVVRQEDLAILDVLLGQRNRY